LRPVLVFELLSRAGVHEGVTVRSRWTGNFCRTAGAGCLYLLLRCTWRQRFGRSFVPLRVSQSNGHGKCKHCYSENPQHGYSLPKLDEGTLSEPKPTTYEARAHGELEASGAIPGLVYFQLRIMMSARRFPPPWSVEEGETYFVVKDQSSIRSKAAHPRRGPADRGEYR